MGEPKQSFFGVTLAKALNLVTGAVFVSFPLLLFVAVVFFGNKRPDWIAGGLLTLLGGVSGLMGMGLLWVSDGLSRLDRRAFKAQYWISFVGMLGFPLGTLLHLIVLYQWFANQRLRMAFGQSVQFKN
jgi:hypothetical protein